MEAGVSLALLLAGLPSLQCSSAEATVDPTSPILPVGILRQRSQVASDFSSACSVAAILPEMNNYLR